MSQKHSDDGARTRRDTLLSNAHFRVFIDGTEYGFRAIERLTCADHESRSKTEPGTTPRRLVLRRGLTQNRDLYLWRQSATCGKPDLRDITIEQLDRPGGRAVNRWHVQRCRPTSWSGPSFDAIDGDIAYEDLEVAYERLEWESH